MADERPDQRTLPFSEAQGSFDEELNLLGLALQRVEADLHLAQFMRWLFNTTDGGAKGPLKKSYAQLAARPWGLCCSEAKARATVREARRRNLVKIVETTTADGGQSANAYWYDRELIRGVLKLRPPVLLEHPLGATAQGDVLREHPLGATAQALIGIPPFQSPLNTSVSRSNERTKAQMLSGTEQRQQIADALDRAGVWQVAEVREGRALRVAPLPPEILVRDALRPIELRHLTSAPDLTRWFRRQLSIERPFTGDSQAELLLVLAAGLATAAIPQRDVKKDRLAIFKATIARGIWKTVLWQVPQASTALGELLAAYPECLTYADWPGPRAELLTPT